MHFIVAQAARLANYFVWTTNASIVVAFVLFCWHESDLNNRGVSTAFVISAIVMGCSVLVLIPTAYAWIRTEDNTKQGTTKPGSQ